MSYLHLPRLCFAGTFTANPSTINNTIANYNPNNMSFPAVAPNNTQPALNWNPYGNAYWTVDCTVQSFVDEDGRVHVQGDPDPLLGATVKSDSSVYGVEAKLVDLDTDQQTRTRLFGLVLTIALPSASDTVTSQYALQAEFENSGALGNLWFTRVPNWPDPDQGAGGIFQSILVPPKGGTGSIWGNVSGSSLLGQLQAAAQRANGASIRIATYAFDDNSSSPTFTKGKIVGAIGPQYAKEAKHIVAGRLLSAVPGSILWNAPAIVDAEKCRLSIDLSNAVPEQKPGGAPVNLGTMQAAILVEGAAEPILVGEIDYSEQSYRQNSGIADLQLTGKQAHLVADNALAILTSAESPATCAVSLKEGQNGLYISVDEYTIYMNPGDEKTVDLYARRYGSPYSASIGLSLTPQQSVDGSTINNMPATALSFPSSVTTDAAGYAQITLAARDPSPREFRRAGVDGQLYFIGGDWTSPADAGLGAPLTVKVFNSHVIPDQPTWQEVQPVLFPYYKLYAYMASIVDLSNNTSVKASAQAIRNVLTLPFGHPNHMPVTRELARDHVRLIVKWIDNGCPSVPEPPSRAV